MLLRSLCPFDTTIRPTNFLAQGRPKLLHRGLLQFAENVKAKENEKLFEVKHINVAATKPRNRGPSMTTYNTSSTAGQR